MQYPTVTATPCAAIGEEPAILSAAIGCRPQLAARLVSRFGSIYDLVGAAERADEAIPDRYRVRLAALRQAVQVLTRERIFQAPVISSSGALIEYCRAHLAHLPVEHFATLHLNVKNRLIAAEIMSRGTIDHAPVYPREIVRRALTLNSSALVLVHCHPSGDPAPSRSDIEMTRAIQAALRTVDIAVHDHLIIGLSGHASLKAHGLME